MARKYNVWIIYTVIILSIIGGIVITNQTVTTISEYHNNDANICIIIDPGHGGEDGGAVSVSGRAESLYNLEIATRLKDLLHLLGYKTLMTRESDVSIYTKGETLSEKKVSDLKERVKLVNHEENALLLSIHQNYYQEEKYAGPQVFFSDTEESEALAKHLQKVLSDGVHPPNNRIAKKSNGIYLMEHVRCPAALVECGFLSNYKEESALRNPEYQKKISGLIAVGVSQYLSST